MNKVLQFFYDSARESFGVPARLLRLLGERPELCVQLEPPPAHIGLDSVVPWHDWTQATSEYRHRKPGWTVGWYAEREHYQSYEATLFPLMNFTQVEIDENWSCDIRDVHGFAASKSDLHEFHSTDAMVEANSQELITDLTSAGLRKNLAHKEIRIIHGQRGSDYFVRHLWDGRVFLMNSGGSHHFAAAKYIANLLPEQVRLHGPLHTYSINSASVHELCDEFELFAISDEPAISVGFGEAMRWFEAEYQWRDMPRTWPQARAILLPRHRKRSMKVAKALRTAGAFDLGEHIMRLVIAQDARRD